MNVRRVVTGIDGQGRSVVVSDGLINQAPREDVWRTSPAEPLGNPNLPLAAAIDPPLGGTRWVVSEVQPGADGPVHTTETVDYVMVLDGELTLVLDEGSVNLRRGDCVVQCNTAHAWRNTGTVPATIAAVLVSLTHTTDDSGGRTTS